MGDNTHYVYMTGVCNFLRGYSFRVNPDKAIPADVLSEILNIDPLYLVKEARYFSGLQYIPDDYHKQSRQRIRPSPL